ncbi:DUF4174 domain-containing protein [Algoriphagus confluentis]
MIWTFVGQDSLTPRDFVGKNRLLIVVDAGRGEEDWFSKELKSDLGERKLMVFVYSKGNLIQTNCTQLVDPNSFIQQVGQKQAGGKASNWVLIGLDGGKKYWGVGWPLTKNIFNQIDSMPMRQSEIRRKGKGG